MPEHNGGIIEPGSFPVLGIDGTEALYIPKDMHITLDGEPLRATRREKPVPNFAEVTVKVNAEMTPEGKQIIRTMVAEVLKEALADERAIIPFANVDALRAFIRAEVVKAIEEKYLHE